MTFRFPIPLAQAIEAQARATGRDRTSVVADALVQVFGLSLPTKAPITIDMLQQQIEQVESSITGLAERLATLQQTTPTDSHTPSRLDLLEQFGYALEASLLTALRDSQSDPAPAKGRMRSSSPAVSSLQHTSEQPDRLQFAGLEPQTCLLESILATMTDPIFVCDRAQRLLYINPLGARSLGLEQNTALQQTIQAFALPPELKAQLTLQLEAVFTTGRSITSEISITTPLYGLRDYEYSLSPIQGSIEYIEAVLFSTQDITKHKQVEAVLKAAEANYQNLFESTNDSILILDALTWRPLNANTNASNRLGYTRQELLQLEIDTIFPRWHGEIVFDLSQRLQTHGKSVCERYLRHKNGTDIPVEVHSRLIEYGDRLAIQSFIRELSKFRSPDVDRSQRTTAQP